MIILASLISAIIWNSQCNSSKMVSGVSKTTNWERSKTQSTLKRVDYFFQDSFLILHQGFIFILSCGGKLGLGEGGKTPAMTIQQSVWEPGMGMTYTLWHFVLAVTVCFALVLFYFCAFRIHILLASVIVRGKQANSSVIAGLLGKLARQNYHIPWAQHKRTEQQSPGRIKGTRKVEGTCVCLLVTWNWGVTWESEKEVKWDEGTQISL